MEPLLWNQEKLEAKAREIREEIIKMTFEAGSGHPGGSLSAVEIVTTLYFHWMKLDPENPRREDRDRFVLSKGHAAPVLYAALAHRGFFPREDLKSLRQLDSHLQGHPDMKKTPGVEMTTGSLGQGLSAAVGMALAGKLDNRGYGVYVLVGDGESQEGQIWEAAMSAAHYRLDNLVGFLDYNQIQLVGPCKEVMEVSPVAEKWKAFGWEVLEIDGHNISQIIEALKKAEQVTGKPTMIVAHTVKGKGVSFMENNAGWHGKAPNEEEMKQALAELRGEKDE